MTGDPAAGLAPILSRAASGERLGRHEARAAFDLVLSGDVPDVQIAGLLTALAVRGETPEEIAGAAEAMRARMIGVDLGTTDPGGLVDVCGTGGSGLHTLNVSTATAMVLAGLGVPVAKHGSRAASSQSGSSDVLGALGVGMTRPEQAAGVMAEAGLVFLFAPYHHPGVGRLAGVRSGLGFRTAFNVLGPLCNPAGVKRQLLGVATPAYLDIMAGSLALAGATRAWVVRGEDGLDELTVCGASDVRVVEDGTVRAITVTPEEAGLARHAPGALSGGTPEANADAMRAMLGGTPGAYRDGVVLNAAAGLIVAGREDDLATAARVAETAIDDGSALSALDRLVTATTHP